MALLLVKGKNTRQTHVFRCVSSSSETTVQEMCGWGTGSDFIEITSCDVSLAIQFIFL